jgi:hypothetical protein
VVKEAPEESERWPQRISGRTRVERRPVQPEASIICPAKSPKEIRRVIRRSGLPNLFHRKEGSPKDEDMAGLAKKKTRNASSKRAARITYNSQGDFRFFSFEVLLVIPHFTFRIDHSIPTRFCRRNRWAMPTLHRWPWSTGVLE